MATWGDVRRIALGLPETAESTSYGGASWQVRKKTFVWERPLRKTDLAALGESAPTGPILGVRVADEVEKEALIAERPQVYFTTPHFAGYPAVLVLLEAIDVDELTEITTDAWLAVAPKRLAAAFTAERG